MSSEPGGLFQSSEMVSFVDHRPPPGRLSESSSTELDAPKSPLRGGGRTRHV